MLVPQGVHDGFVAATKTPQGATMTIEDQVKSDGSFTEPEYAQVGINGSEGSQTHDVVVSIAVLSTKTGGPIIFTGRLHRVLKPRSSTVLPAKSWVATSW